MVRPGKLSARDAANDVLRSSRRDPRLFWLVVGTYLLVAGTLGACWWVWWR